MMSYISIRNNPNFKESIMTIIYKIYPVCKITNLLTSKNIFICEEKNQKNSIIVNSLKQINFNFFGKEIEIPLLIGLLIINNDKNGPLVLFKLKAYVIYSFCIENTLFNIEVKDSIISGILDIFFVETNFDNAKIIIENLSDHKFSIYQGGYEQFLQPIKQNDKIILRIYNQNINYFIVKNSENNKSYRFTFNSFIEEEHRTDIDNLIFIKESNGIKIKLTILSRKDFIRINNSITKLNLNIKIEKIILSVITDNEFKEKKLRN